VGLLFCRFPRSNDKNARPKTCPSNWQEKAFTKQHSLAAIGSGTRLDEMPTTNPPHGAPVNPNPFSPPQASVADRGAMTEPAWQGAARILIGLLLMGLWIWDRPHQMLSEAIGRHFAWPAAHALKWFAVLLERTLIEAFTCLPVAFVLVRFMRTWALTIAIALWAIEAVIVLPQLRFHPIGSHWLSFLLFFIGVHFLFLVGGTVCLRRFTNKRCHVSPRSNEPAKT
jgi:hypothetical protein